MPDLALVVDSTHYLPRDVAERHEFHEVSLYINWNGRTQRESDLGDYDDFYRQLRAARGLPSTSQPSVGDFIAAYEPLVEAGRDILSIHISGGISGTVAAAEQAREQLVEGGADPTRFVVLDSRSSCAVLGVMAVAAGNAARAGADLDGALAAAHAVRDRMRALFAVETLEYLRRGGRIGAANAWFGTALQVKPILRIEGTIEPVERVRTSGRAHDRLVEYLREDHEAGCDIFFIQHVHAPEVAAEIAERGREIYGRGPELVSEMGPVIGAHVGPGLIGVAGLPSSLVGPV
jgi:DegV family protein with EDD domain